MGVSWRTYPDDPGLSEGMFLSNGTMNIHTNTLKLETVIKFLWSMALILLFCFVEPGYYEDGKFGIRLENIERVVPAETKYKLPIRKFLTFETVTMVPVQTKMLVPELLTEKEVSATSHFFSL